MTNVPQALASIVRSNQAYRRIWSGRLRQVAAVLGRSGALAETDRSLEDSLGRIIEFDNIDEVWLAMAAVSGQLPSPETVIEVHRRSRLNGARPLREAIAASSIPDAMHRDVRIVTAGAVVDVHNTARSPLSTGIQRVVREVVPRWQRATTTTEVAWLDDFRAMRELTSAERRRMAGEPPLPTSDDQVPAIIVPWQSTYLLPELVVERPRTARIAALARYAEARTGVIGYDCIPLTSGETTDEGMPNHFADYLAAIRHFDAIAAIAEGAALEFEGWRTMLGAIGVAGPLIAAVGLPTEAPAVPDSALAEARRRFVVAGRPLVLCVGTHEPRKNHGAVLHAAEQLWREGLQFSLTFVGGHSWREHRFAADLQRLQDAGCAVETASGIDDDLLWAAYRVARCSVFPSFDEGFGLPVAESLAAGTPAITSGFGSMAEIAADGGALLVDPRDDRSLTRALRTLLVDDGEHARLAAEALARPSRTWDQYAQESLALLLG